MKYTEEEKRYMIVQSLIEPKVYGLNDLRLLDWALIWKDIQIAELLIRFFYFILFYFILFILFILFFLHIFHNFTIKKLL